MYSWSLVFLTKATSQQNAASSEEITATAEELATQAEQLQTTIAFFQVGEVDQTTLGEQGDATHPLDVELTEEKESSRFDKFSLELKQGEESGDERDEEFERY